MVATEARPQSMAQGRQGSGGRSGAAPPRRRSHGGGDADYAALNSIKEELGDSGAHDISNCSSNESSRADTTPRGPRGEEELASRVIHVQSKRFYMDAKENPRGRFIKIAEVLPDGSKARIALSLTSAREFRNHLAQFEEFVESSKSPTDRKGSTSSNEDNRNAPLKSAVIYGNGGARLPVVGRRRYFLDLKENRRGKFLQVAEAASRAGLTTRNQIVVPAQGIGEFRKHLSGLLEEFWPEDDSELGDLDEGNLAAKTKDFPQSKSLRVHQGKILYFDSGVNPRGSYLRISQVTTRFRTSILLPRESLQRVHDLLGDILGEFDTPQAPKSPKPASERRTPPKKGASPKRSPKVTPEKRSEAVKAAEEWSCKL